MKLPAHLQNRLKQIAPYRDYFRRQLAIERKAPSKYLPVLVVQFYQTFKDKNKRLEEDQNLKQAFIASEDFVKRLVPYLKSIGKLPDGLTGIELGFIKDILYPQPQLPPREDKKAIDTEQILLIGGIALVGLVLILK